MNTFRSLPSWLNTLTVLFLLLAFTLTPVNAHAAPVQETRSVSRNVDVTLPIPPFSTGANDQQEPITPLQPSDTPELAEAAASEDIPSDWLSQVQENIRQSEYHVTWQEQTHLSDLPGAYQAPNRAHNLRTYFTPDGIRIVRRTEAEPSWEWGLMLTGYGYAADVQPVAAAGLVSTDNRIEYHRSNLTASPGENQAIVEWYVNSEQGLEQGFTLVTAPESRISNPGSQIALDLTLSGNLTAYPSTDGSAVEFNTPSGVRVLRYGELYAYDVTGRELPVQLVPLSAEEAANDLIDTIRLVVDSMDAVYPITVDPLATSLGWTAESNQNEANFGFSVSTAGDVNNDGYSDVIVGAPLYDSDEDTDVGRAYVYTGTASGLSTVAAWTAESDLAGAKFGQSVSTAGDVNGDGYADVIVGAHTYGNGETNEGRAYVYTGTASGLSTVAAWTAESNQENARFGASVSTAGDVNGDGYSDVIVGAHGYSSTLSNEGRAYVYTGTASGLSTVAAWTAEGNQENARFGKSVGTAGDVDGNGYDDIIVGAHLYDTSSYSDTGKAYVYTGTASGLSTVAAWTTEGNQAYIRLGSSVSTAGDVNGDGYSDVIVGARLYDTSSYTDVGRAYVYTGTASGLSTVAAWTAESDQNTAWFGLPVSTAGDVNGDGYSDVIVGAHGYDGSQTNEGRTHVYYGSAAGLNSTAGWTIESDQDGAYFGYSVGTAGDVNGDGYSDIIVGAYLYDNSQTDEGRAYVYHGSPSGLVTTSDWTAEGNQNEANFGLSVSTAGDVDNDGYSDVIVGAPLYDITGKADAGRAYVYTGTASGLSTVAAWTADSDLAGAKFGQSVSTAGDVNGDGYADVIVGAHTYGNGETSEGRAYVYTGTASGLSTVAAWTVESNQAQARFGASVGTAGDVNGDGYSDVIVGAHSYSSTLSNEGRAYVYTGTASGLSTVVAWTAVGNQENARFGKSVGTAGDINGDGYDDIIVGAHLYDTSSYTDTGKAYVYTGTASGLSTVAAWTTEGNQAYIRLGASVSTAGDVNGDGYSDVIVGAHLYDTSSHTDVGRVYVYTGTALGLSTVAAWTAESDQDTAWFGLPVSTAGDVNGDGYSDVIVGAHGYNGNQTDEGRAYVYYGSAAGLNSTADWTAESDQDNAYFGRSVGTAGDVNGDGYSDIIVGAYLYDTSSYTDTGKVYVYHGGATGLSTTAGWTAGTSNGNSKFGFSVGTAGDVNGDGYNDVIVGAYSFDTSSPSPPNAGKVFVYHGSATGPSTTEDWSKDGDQQDAQFGHSVGTAGDVNGDGFSDVIIGAPMRDSSQAQDQEGWVFVYHGSSSGLTTGSADWTAEGNENYAHFGYSVGTAGDVNGDGFSDVIIGTPHYDNPSYCMGQARVYMGASSGLNTAASWSALGSGGGVQFGHSVGTAGDVNGDGYSDVIVGAPLENDGVLDHNGKAFLYLGTSSSPYLSTTADWTDEGTQDNEYFGYSVDTAGDVNGDGFSDVIVGAHLYDDGLDSDVGKAFVYHGTSSSPYLSTMADWTAVGDQSNEQFGFSVGAAGDVNGDGFSDVIVGADNYPGDTGYYKSKAYVYHGTSEGLNTSANWAVEGTQIDQSFDVSVGTAGDVNGDGYSDVIVGADYGDGRADLYYGNGGDGLEILPRQVHSDGLTIAPLGNVTTTVKLSLIGRMPLGRADVKLQWQIAPLGTAFTATSGVISGTSTTWTDTGTDGAVITETITGLTADTLYHWRARLLYRPGNRMGQSASRWVHISWNGWRESDFHFRTDD